MQPFTADVRIARGALNKTASCETLLSAVFLLSKQAHRLAAFDQPRFDGMQDVIDCLVAIGGNADGFPEGISKSGEILDLGVKAGVVEKSGAWFSYDSQRIGQGRENAKAFLKANPDIAGKIEAAIRQNAGLIAERILADADPSPEEAAEG